MSRHPRPRAVHIVALLALAGACAPLPDRFARARDLAKRRFTVLNTTRRDALIFTSRPLANPVEVTGPMSAALWAATDAKDTDWNVMVLDVFPDGRAERVQDGVARARAFGDGSTGKSC